jgi:hypothetical protein
VLDAFAPCGSALILHVGCHVQINDSAHIGAIDKGGDQRHTLIVSRIFLIDHDHDHGN